MTHPGALRPHYFESVLRRRRVLNITTWIAAAVNGSFAVMELHRHRNRGDSLRQPVGDLLAAARNGSRRRVIHVRIVGENRSIQIPVLGVDGAGVSIEQRGDFQFVADPLQVHPRCS